MVLERKAASSRLILTATSAKKESIQADLTIIIPNMTGMRFCTGHLFPSEIEAEMFSAVMAEFKEVLIQDRATNLTVTDLHFSPKNKGARVRGFTGSSSVGIYCRRNSL
jgi:hypothetical protein